MTATYWNYKDFIFKQLLLRQKLAAVNNSRGDKENVVEFHGCKKPLPAELGTKRVLAVFCDLYRRKPKGC